MNKRKKIIVWGLSIILILFLISLLVDTDRETDSDELLPEEIAAHIESKSDLITVAEPEPMSRISSPLIVRGEARGTWYFEADFPISIINESGEMIAQWYASAVLDPNDPESTWMTEDFVPFEGTIEFPIQEEGSTGTLIFHKDNPTGLEEHDDALEIPIRF